MPVDVRLFGAVRDDADTDRLSLDPATVGAVLRHIETTYSALDGALLDDAAPSGVREAVVVTVDTTDVRHLDGVETTLADGDVVRVTRNAYPRR